MGLGCRGRAGPASERAACPWGWPGAGRYSWVSGFGPLGGPAGWRLAAWRASSFEYDTRARNRYASCVPPTGRRMATSVGCGAMAQLVARLHGMQKVRGSNPLSSTDVVSRDMCDI